MSVPLTSVTKRDFSRAASVDFDFERVRTDRVEAGGASVAAAMEIHWMKVGSQREVFHFQANYTTRAETHRG